ncbi:TIGR02530 family flagellar biosynthesis protein [Oscillospiraceae bacterium PP1C4]
MNNIYLNRLSTPVVTGIPQHGTVQAQQSTDHEQVSFQQMLKEQISRNSNLTFSKHAVSRMVERNVDLTDSSIARLNEGVRIAEEKGLNDTLILVDRTAFIVNIKNGTVITTVNQNDSERNVFTNIDGTVII